MASEQPRARAPLAPVSVYSGSDGVQVQQLGNSRKSSTRRLSVSDAQKGGHGAVASPSKKRRSQSMGGALSEAAAVRAAAAQSAMELSPRKRARRSLVPGRSILKPAALIQQHSYDGQTTGNYTTTLYTQTLAAATMSYSSKNNQNNDDDEAASSSDEGNGDSDTAANDNTTRRLSRRVSFAPTAQLREFSKDANEDEDYADESLSNIGASSSPAAPPAKQAASIHIAGVSNALTTPTATSASIASPSPAKAAAHGRRRSSSRGSSTGHRRRSSVANAQSLVDSFNTAPKEGALPSNDAKTSSVDQSLSTIMPNGDESNLLSNESAMDLADTSDVTTAFKSHFVFPSTSSQPEAETSFAASAASGNASNIMDMADDDVTSAFALNTHLFGAPSPARSSLQTNSIFTQPSPAHLAAHSPFRPSASNPISPAASRRRQSHSPSKKVQQQRRESEIKAAWDAEAVRRRSLIYGQNTEVSSSTSTTTTSTSIHVTQDERTHREYHVPLGVEGIDEEAIIQLQRERAKRGSAAFFANRQSTGSSAQVSLFGSTITQTDTSVFSMHHSTDEHDGSMHMTNGEEDTDDQTMDMSIVQDTRRVSNVFAVFTDSRAVNDNDLAGPQIEELADDSPSLIKNGSLYPSIEKLQQETSHLQSPTPGDKALAFLDEEDEEYDRTTTTGDDAADQREEQTEGITEVLARQTPIDEQNTEAEGEPSDSSAQAIELESAPAPFNPYDFQRHRLSIVPERRDEEDLEEEEDDDRTQDMEETAVYGNVVQPEPVRRLSMAHPRHSLPQASPAESPAQNAKSPGKSNFVSSMKIPSPIVQQQIRRESVSPEIVKSKSPKEQTGTKGRHSLAIPSMPPMAFTSLNEDGPQTESESLFKPVTSGSGTASSMGMSIASAALPSPARPPRSPSMRTGLTPDMRRLNSEDRRRKSTLSSMLASPAPVHGLSRLSGRESLAPNPEPFFEENAPHDGLDGEETEKPKISLDQFLSIADIQFMDGLLSVSQAPGANMKRKNASRPSLERGTSNPYGSVSLSDQISASAAVLPFLEGYRMMVSELRKSLRENSDVMDEMEEQIEEETPSLFLDYATADEEDRAMLDTHFKVTRAYYRLQTRNEWYMFRNGVSTSIAQMLHGHIEGLTADKAVIDETYRRLTTDHLPSLRDRAKELAEELANEKARQQELQECDQEHLNELRIAIKEQNSTIEDYKRDVAQTEGTLERLRQKEEELDTQAKECKDCIEASKKVCDEVRYYTKSELWRLQDELDLVQYLHAWQLVQYDSTRMELSHHNELTITVLFGARGQVEDFELILLDQARDNAIDQNAQNRKMLTTFLFDRLIAHVGLPQIRQYKIKDLLRTVSNIWTRARYIRSTFAILAQQYPVQMSMLTKKSRSSGQPFLRSSARIYAEAVRAEFNVIFELTGDETSEVNPHGNEIEDCVQDIGVSVDVKYGNVDREELLCIVRESVANAGNKALLEACQEAEARYA